MADLKDSCVKPVRGPITPAASPQSTCFKTRPVFSRQSLAGLETLSTKNKKANKNSPTAYSR